MKMSSSDPFDLPNINKPNHEWWREETDRKGTHADFVKNMKALKKSCTINNTKDHIVFPFEYV